MIYLCHSIKYAINAVPIGLLLTLERLIINNIQTKPKETTMNFLPANYQAPKSASFYMKLQDGENRIRILSKPIVGWLDWQDKKPVRYRMENKPAKPFNPEIPLRHFWAFIVFNHAAEEIQILEITQATIRKTIESLCNDKDWGAPFGYDIKIVKTGEGKDTEYAVNPVPHKPVDPYIIKCFKERPCALDALFHGADPFSKEWKAITKLAMEEDDMPIPEHNLNTVKEESGTIFKSIKNTVTAQRDKYQKMINEDAMAVV